MARIQFEPPASFRFRIDIPLDATHINVGGHLDNVTLLALVNEARTAFFDTLRGPGSGLEGLSVFVGDVVAQYITEAFADEVMHIEMEPLDFNRYGFDLAFQVSDRDSGRVVARGKQGLVLYDRAVKKVALLPAPLRERLGG